MWQPPAPELEKIRKEIVYNPKDFLKVVNHKDFKTQFGKLDEEDKLKTSPKGFEKDHPQADFLKHKSFVVMHHFSDKEVMSKEFLKLCSTTFKAMMPLNKFLRMACE